MYYCCSVEFNRVPVDEINSNEEILDSDSFQETNLDSVEQHKSLILNLLNRLKLGMDLTRVPLPTFVLQSRSFLESCSDFMANCDFLAKLNDLLRPEERMCTIVKWYLTAFYFACRQGIAKKPYNPMLGEVFRCKWYPHSSPDCIFTFVAEQVSHHPPISAFYASCPAKNLHLNCFLWTKSKFMGTSVAAHLIGETVLFLGKFNEVYRITFPSVYGRSILTHPWLELGGKTNIICDKTNMSSTVIFHTKPFYGGKLHKVTAEVKYGNNPLQQSAAPSHIIAKVNGEWNRTLEFQFEESSKVETVEAASLPIAKRQLRPIDKQHPKESRKLWKSVTDALR